MEILPWNEYIARAEAMEQAQKEARALPQAAAAAAQPPPHNLDDMIDSDQVLRDMDEYGAQMARGGAGEGDGGGDDAGGGYGDDDDVGGEDGGGDDDGVGGDDGDGDLLGRSSVQRDWGDGARAPPPPLLGVLTSIENILPKYLRGRAFDPLDFNKLVNKNAIIRDQWYGIRRYIDNPEDVQRNLNRYVLNRYRQLYKKQDMERKRRERRKLRLHKNQNINNVHVQIINREQPTFEDMRKTACHVYTNLVTKDFGVRAIDTQAFSPEQIEAGAADVVDLNLNDPASDGGLQLDRVDGIAGHSMGDIMNMFRRQILNKEDAVDTTVARYRFEMLIPKRMARSFNEVRHDIRCDRDREKKKLGLDKDLSTRTCQYNARVIRDMIYQINNFITNVAGQPGHPMAEQAALIKGFLVYLNNGLVSRGKTPVIKKFVKGPTDA